MSDRVNEWMEYTASEAGIRELMSGEIYDALDVEAEENSVTDMSLAILMAVGESLLLTPSKFFSAREYIGRGIGLSVNGVRAWERC